MARNPQPWHPLPSAVRRGFTLIELILVMGLLAFILTITTPTLSNFFEGRRMREEARRLLALTRFARVEAVSRSTPMELWIEEDQYGLRERLTGEGGGSGNATGNGDLSGDAAGEGTQPREYQVADGLKLECESGQQTSRGKSVIQSQGLILFQPDGTIDDDESLARVTIIDSKEHEMVIERSEVGVGFIVLEDDAVVSRRR